MWIIVSFLCLQWALYIYAESGSTLMEPLCCAAPVEQNRHTSTAHLLHFEFLEMAVWIQNEALKGLQRKKLVESVSGVADRYKTN